MRYYKLSETPAYYITAWYNLLSGKWEFGKVHATETTVEGVTVELKTNGHHATYEMKISGFDLDYKANKVYGVVLTAADGSEYGLHHVTNIWRGTELGFNTDEPYLASIIGKTDYSDHLLHRRRCVCSCRSAWRCKFAEGCLIQPTYSTKRQGFLIAGDLAVL
ncbi:MAG: hypothetical protein V8R95_05735 [Faecalibacterium sp.]